MSALGKVLREYREGRHMSLQDVAEEAGLSKAHVWELEMGRSNNPSVSALVGLGVALNISPILLFSAAVTTEDGSQSPVTSDGEASKPKARATEPKPSTPSNHTEESKP